MDRKKWIVKTYTDYNKSLQFDLKLATGHAFTSQNAEKFTKEEFLEKLKGLV